MRKFFLILVAMCAASAAHSQAVTLTGAARLKITLNCEANTKRCTGDIDVTPNTAPFWHADGNTGSAIESSFGLTQNSVSSINFNTRATDNEADVLTITLQSGSVTGMSLTAGVFSGTPTVVQSPSLVFRVCDPAPLCADATITMAVAAPPPSDNIPDQFSFLPQSNVTQSSVITSSSVVVSGINIASAVTVSGGTWNKNGGAFTSSAGTVVAGDTVTVRHTSPGIPNGLTQTTLTIGGVSAVFSSTTAGNPARVGIFYALGFDSFSSTKKNPEDADWPVANTSAVDGMGPDHLAEAQYGASAPVRNLAHLEIISSNPTPCGGAFAARATIYPKIYTPTVDYSTGNFQSSDKPRVNFRSQSALFGLAWRTTYWMAVCVWLPSNYIEESGSKPWNEILMQAHTACCKNVWDLEINGKSGGSTAGSTFQFALRRSTSENGTATSEVTAPEFDILDSYKGAWNVFIVKYNADNRTSGGSPVFKVWHCTYDEITLAVEIPCALRINSTIPFGYSTVGVPDGHQFSMNVYKGGWHGATQGAYDGGKTDPIIIGFDEFRFGDATSGYSDVHPFQEAQP